jgi:hypothetical protein
VICRHCNQSKVNRPRGLCWRCYYTPGLRDLYASMGLPALLIIRGRPSSAPTSAFPGTEAKIAVLAARAGRREELFHPDDFNPGAVEMVDPPFLVPLQHGGAA